MDKQEKSQKLHPQRHRRNDGNGTTGELGMVRVHPANNAPASAKPKSVVKKKA